MEFSINRKEILKGLQRVQGIVERRTAMPILANVLLEAKKGQLVLTATDHEVGLRGSYPAQVTKEGAVTLPAKNLYEIVRELQEEEVVFKKKENLWIHIVCGKAEFNIVGLSADDYPAIPNYKDKKFYEIAPEILQEMIHKTLFSASSDETRYHLNGVFFEKPKKSSNQIRMVATDGHRLSLINKEIAFSKELSFNRGIIIPKKGLNELNRILEEGEGNYQIGFDSNNVIIKKEKVVLFIRLIDGEYPDYEQVIPSDNKKKIVVNRENFLNCLKRISLLSSERSKAIKLTAQEGLLTISTSNPELGEAKEEIEIEYEGTTPIEAGFNAKYFMDILHAMSSEKVLLELNDKLSPGIMKALDDNDYVCVVMPVRI
ncbi:MAG: DNA polymerase III subunit beta [Deltaproteobacteria bacterium]|nr:DNA polymerase III subunit beta [Deltaproteobacteria bacterium]